MRRFRDAKVHCPLDGEGVALLSACLGLPYLYMEGVTEMTDIAGVHARTLVAPPEWYSRPGDFAVPLLTPNHIPRRLQRRRKFLAILILALSHAPCGPL
jgi:hypothetical protein